MKSLVKLTSYNIRSYNEFSAIIAVLRIFILSNPNVVKNAVKTDYRAPAEDVYSWLVYSVANVIYVILIVIFVVFVVTFVVFILYYSALARCGYSKVSWVNPAPSVCVNNCAGSIEVNCVPTPSDGIFEFGFLGCLECIRFLGFTRHRTKP